VKAIVSPSWSDRKTQRASLFVGDGSQDTIGCSGARGLGCTLYDEWHCFLSLTSMCCVSDSCWLNDSFWAVQHTILRWFCFSVYERHAKLEYFDHRRDHLKI
jgi:hypothetical protein